MRILHDEHVRQLAPWVAVDAARRGLLAAHAGRLTSPPRLRAEAGATDYVFTVGGLRDGVSGFRAYRTGPRAGDHLVAVWNHDGELAGVVVGAELGARRTGALGAAAGADIVVLATTSTSPVLDAAAIRPGTHLTTVGPKCAGAHELPAGSGREGRGHHLRLTSAGRALPAAVLRRPGRPDRARRRRGRRGAGAHRGRRHHRALLCWPGGHRGAPGCPPARPRALGPRPTRRSPTRKGPRTGADAGRRGSARGRVPAPRGPCARLRRDGRAATVPVTRTRPGRPGRAPGGPCRR